MKIETILSFAFAVCMLVSCGNPDSPDSETGYTAPEPPSTIVENNLIKVEFYSVLNDETLFQTKNYSSVINHITSEKTPLAFFFDRSDAIIGQASPVVEIAWQTRLKSFFIQNETGNAQIQGTGAIVRSLVNVFDGTNYSDSLFLSGCTLTAPCNQPVVLVLMTCKLNEEYQFPLIAETVSDSLKMKTNKLIIGTISSDLKDSFKQYLKYNLTGFRLAFFTSDESAKPYSLFILTPVKFVSREIQELKVGDLPMYQCKIEYLN